MRCLTRWLGENAEAPIESDIDCFLAHQRQAAAQATNVAMLLVARINAP